MVTQYAQNEQNFNSVERVLVYTELSPDGETTTPNDPPPSWPEKGAIKFNDVNLAYREGLPLVLKGTTFEIRPGEKVRTCGISDYLYIQLTNGIGRNCGQDRCR